MKSQSNFKNLTENITGPDEHLSKAELAHQNYLLRMANSAAAILIGGFYSDYEAVLQKALQTFAESMQVDRAIFYKNTARKEDGRLCCFMRSGWTKESSLEQACKQDVIMAYDDFMPNLRAIFEKRQSVRAPVSGLPAGLKSLPGIRDAKSVMLIPLFVNDSFYGMIRFDDCSNERIFKQYEAEIVQSAATIMAYSIIRHEKYVKISESRESAIAGDKVKSEFLSRMSHEIRTPMNVILGMSAVARKTEDITKIHYCLGKIDASSRQLLGIINDVLDMSKIDVDKLEISSCEFDFEKMLQNVFGVIQVKTDEKHQDLSFDQNYVFKRKMIGDELRLSQVFINLLDNASKFTPAGGKIVVNVRETPLDKGRSTLRAEVTDNGVGLDPKSQSLLFSSFEQADGSITRKYGGTGLGLTICKKIIDLMGGRIWAESAPDKGSRFIFEIDVAWGEEIDPDTKIDTVPKQLRILTADASEDTREYFRNMITTFSLSCDTASNGEEAVEMVRKSKAEGRPYHLIFLDWNMPGMSAGAAAGEMFGLIGLDTVIVAVSVTDWADIEQEANACGISNFLRKPVLPSMLYNTIVRLTKNSLVTHSDIDMGIQEAWAGKTILLVEDIEINREVIINILEDTGIDIVSVCNGKEAVELFGEKGNAFDLILMDMQMPVMDGLSATRQIRGLDLAWASQVPIVAMTANAFKEDVMMCLEAGMNDHLAKPLDICALFNVLNVYLCGNSRGETAESVIK